MKKFILAWLFFLVLFCLYSYEPVSAFSHNLKNAEGVHLKKIIVTAQVAYSPQQKFLFDKNSIVQLEKTQVLMGEKVAAHLVLKGYQGIGEKNKTIFIQTYNSKWDNLENYSLQTDQNGSIEVSFYPERRMMGESFLSLTSYEEAPFSSSPIFQKIIKIVVKPGFHTLVLSKNAMKHFGQKIPSLLACDCRVNFGFSARGKTAMLTRNNYVLSAQQIIKPKNPSQIFAARDGPRFLFV